MQRLSERLSYWEANGLRQVPEGVTHVFPGQRPGNTVGLGAEPGRGETYIWRHKTYVTPLQGSGQADALPRGAAPGWYVTPRWGLVRIDITQ